jgi:UDP-N-acetylmuramate--alanine ligase
MFDDLKRVHFVGIGGIGMSAIAKWMLLKEIEVTGSDMESSSMTKELEHRGATIYSGHSGSNIPEHAQLLVYSPAVPPENIEREEMRERGGRELSYPELLGEISKEFSTIVVTGTHGKSTTTAMLGLILEAAGYDPTVLVGSLVSSFKDGNLRLGHGRFFVVEGCEYRANMTKLHPEMIVLTNIEEDHLDYYRDLAHIQETFQSFVDKLKGQGMVVVNGDDEGSAALQIARPIMYTSNESNKTHKSHTTYRMTERTTESGAQKIETTHGTLNLQVPGEFNAYNALAALSAAMELGVPFGTCQRALKDFKGIWRRFERVGVWHGADVISDYAHHPTEIQQTLIAAREFFPQRRMILCYQPHQHNRTKELFDDFVEALRGADHLVLTEIYDVAGRNEDRGVSSSDLVKAIKQIDAAKDVVFAPTFQKAKSMLRDIVEDGDVLIIMGAGDIDKLARDL